jgi:hypothetical protein
MVSSLSPRPSLITFPSSSSSETPFDSNPQTHPHTSLHIPDENKIKIKGLVDWAEAEYLPLGMALYFLEELLLLTPSSPSTPSPASSSTTPSNNNNPSSKQHNKLKYHPSASNFRAHFWKTLSRLIPPLRDDPSFRKRVQIAGIAGILLWHGFAFDEGLLDRVVADDDERDGEEVGRLDLMLLSCSSDLSCLDLEDGDGVLN